MNLFPRAATGAGAARNLRNRRWSWGSLAQKYGVIGVWAVLIVIFGALRPSEFLTVPNFETILDSQAILLLLALAFIIPLIAGDLDLSLAGLFTVDIVVIGRMNIVHHIPFGYVWMTVLAIGFFVGLFQAFLIVILDLNSLIVTLGSGTAFLGLASALDNTTRSGVSIAYTNAMNAKFLGLQLTFWIGVVTVVMLWYLYSYTPIGRKLFFVGANKNVARLAGIGVTRLRVGSLVAGSMVAGVSAIVAAGYLNGTDPQLGSEFLLPMISSAFLGTTCITVGRASPWGTFIATYFLVTGYTGLEELGLSGWVQQAFYGTALVIAVAVASLSTRSGSGDVIDFSM